MAEKDVINNDDLGRLQIKGAHSSPGSKNLKWQSNHKFNMRTRGRSHQENLLGSHLALGCRKAIQAKPNEEKSEQERGQK